ncbi:phosphoribosylamine--glycine ligase [Candidatus Peregrinibacteria bacterium]|jgi:phosphoribosylamine--glycine ligase|nr:phosphoribosylamine--glycine ligase [Candidatus Peregrinibacteria bacterium]MBT7338001.1 phosphoribosylamine--glycine ligase [Candidatus Peregrinibacteria bacterium]
MKILLLSLAARGHAIADALARSPQNPDIISVVPAANPGIAALATEQHIADLMDFDAVLNIAKKENPDFAFVAPDDPIGAGLTDVLEAEGIQCVAPRKKLAQVEASKSFARDLLAKHNIDASPAYECFTTADETAIRKFIDQQDGKYVVKYDALKGGKGVKVSGEHLDSIDDGVAYAIECIEECGRVVIEEKLVGVEFSLISFVSGTQVVDTPAIQDHKRAFNGDTGPNTGGMGAWSDANHLLPFIKPADLARAKELNRLTAAALQAECGEDFKGILYGGFIITKKGVQLIEYNARFGDPEALNILPLLQTDFVDICQGIITGDLTDDMVAFERKATVCKYITPESYPESKDQRGQPFTLPVPGSNARIFLGDVSEGDDGELLLGGSRTAGIVGIGDTIAEAEQIAQTLCEQVQGPVRFRSDIGTESLIQKRIDLMNSIRSE